jgi:hypothetical protein
MPKAAQSESGGVTPPSPLASYIRRRRAEMGWTYGDLVQNAREKQVRASQEIFRKAAEDEHLAPLRDDSVMKLAAGLKTSEPEIRRLDTLRWQPIDAPLGANVDPELLQELSDATPEQIQQVRGFLHGIKARP